MRHIPASAAKIGMSPMTATTNPAVPQYGSNKENYQQKYSKTRDMRCKKLKHVRSYHRRMVVFFEPFLLRFVLFEPYWAVP